MQGLFLGQLTALGHILNSLCRIGDKIGFNDYQVMLLVFCDNSTESIVSHISQGLRMFEVPFLFGNWSTSSLHRIYYVYLAGILDDMSVCNQ